MLTKVFRIELTGGKDVEKDIVSISKAMGKMAASIVKAKTELAQLVSTKADPAAISSLTAKITELETKFKNLSAQRKQAETDAKRQAEAEKILADAKLKNAKATQIETDTTIAYNKEIDRQIDREKKETEQLQKKKKELDAQPGSYNSIKKAAQELYAVLKNANSTSVVAAGGKSFSYDQAIAEYKKLSAAEQDFRRQFTKDGTLVGEYTSGIVKAFNDLNIDDIIKNQVTGAKQQLGDLEKKTQELVVVYRQAQQQNITATDALGIEVKQLTAAYDEAKAKGTADLDALKTKLEEVEKAYHDAQTQGTADLNKLEKEIHDNVKETQQLQKAVREAEVQLKGIGGVGEQITGSINKGFKELKNTIGQFVIGYVGFQAVLSGLQTSAENAKTLSDQTTDLEINMGKAKDGADGLISSLKGLDTRTKLSGLEEISNIALKAGTTEQNLLGVTKAIDTVKTAFGKDFGEIEAGTETFVKLINIFYDDGQVTEDRILKIGNSIRTLANETVASVPYINDFAGRMAGLRQVSNVTLPQIVGLGAGFEEFKQSAEVSSTVLVKVIPQMAKDIETFAKIANLTRDEFKKLLQENPIEALLQVSQGLAAGKGDIEVFSKSLGDAGIDAGRAISIISTLGGKADIFRDRIVRAGTAIQSTDAITDAFNRKNENLAATMDKISKRFADAAGSKGFQTTLLVLTSLVTFLLNNIPLLLVLGGLLALNWAKQNAQLVLLNARILLYNLAIGASYVALGILTAAQTAYNAVLFVFNGAIGLATKALQLFNITVKAGSGPLGIILTLFSLLGAAALGLSKAFARSVDQISEHNLQLKISKDILIEANKAIADQKAKVEGYAAVVRDTTISEQTRLKALQDLIAINPAFSKALQGNKIDLSALNDVIKEYNANLLKKAQLEAAQALQQKEYSKLVELQTLKSSLEVAKAQKTGFGDLTDEQRGAFSKITTSVGRTAFTSDLFNLSISDKDFKEAFSGLDNQIKAQEKILAATTDVLKGAYDKAGQTIDEGNKKITAATQPSESVFQIFDRLVANNGTGADFKELLKKIQVQKKLTAVTSEEYKKLLDLEKKVRDLIKPKAGRGSGENPIKKELDEKLKASDAKTTNDQNKLDEQFAQGLVSERDYYTKVRDITIKGEQEKINIIQFYQNKYKNALAQYEGDLAKGVSEAEKKKIQAKRDANQKLFEVDNKQLEKALRDEQNAAGRDKEATLLNPELSYEDQIQTTIDYYDRLLLAQIVFNQKQLELEKLYGVKSVENAQKRKEEIEKIRKELEAAERQKPEAQIKDIQDAGDRQVREINIYYAKQRKAILDNTKLTAKERERQLDELDKSQRRTILSAELAALNIEVKKLEALYKKGLISRDQYLKAVEAQNKKAEELSAALLENKKLALPSSSTTQEVVDEQLSKAFGLGDGKESDLLGNIIAESFSFAKDAMNSYFDAQNKRLEQEKQNRLDELDQEKERVKARAGSKAEEDAIERQYAQKKKAIDKEYGEQFKKQKKAEAKIALATELGNIAVAAASNPLNGVTFGASGAIMYGILAALALGKYALRISEINKTQFAFGGNLKKKFGLGGNANEVPVNGGVFGGRPHSQGGTDFEFGGQKFNAEVDEMNIIRTRNAPKTGVYSITGSQKQIASALNSIGGGVSFASGAAVKKMATGGYLGSSLKAPYFSAGAYLNGGSVGSSYQKEDMQELKTMIAEVATAVYASDKKEVVLQPGKVTQAQRKTKKDVSTGTL